MVNERESKGRRSKGLPQNYSSKPKNESGMDYNNPMGEVVQVGYLVFSRGAQNINKARHWLALGTPANEPLPGALVSASHSLRYLLKVPPAQSN